MPINKKEPAMSLKNGGVGDVEGNPIDSTDILKQILKMNNMTLSPFQKGVNKKLEEMGAAQTEEALMQGVPPEHIQEKSGLNPKEILAKIVGYTPFSIEEGTGKVTPASILGGLISAHPDDTLKRVQAQELMQKSKQQESIGVYGFDPISGEVKLLKDIPKGSEVRSMQPQTGIETLPPDQQVAASALARKIAGVRGAQRVEPRIVAGLNAGKSLDQIEDEIRYSQQSTGLSGEWRNAAQSILGTKSTESQRNVVLDTLDDYRQNGDDEGAKEYLKNISRESAPVDMQNRVMGKERTVDFLDEIQSDLDLLEKNGIGTGFLRGNIDGLMTRIGRTVAPQFREAATKIAVATINYRNAMSGVAFGEKESAEYRRLFPGTNRVGEFNSGTIKALKKSFSGDVEKFYQQRMGLGNYNKLFKESNKDSEYEQYLKIIGAQ